MNRNDFSKLLTAFLTEHLPLTKNVSKNTISSYCDSFRLYLVYLRDVENTPPERITMKNINSLSITGFLLWLEQTRNCAVSTRNQRLAAIHAFARYCQFEHPQHLEQLQKIIQIPFKKTKKPTVSFLSPETTKLLLEQPDTRTQRGRRDLTLLSLLYDTGARVQELADLRVRDVHFADVAYVTLNGKGQKSRNIPLLSQTTFILRRYFDENRLRTPEKLDYPLFANRQNDKLTRSGISFILKKYADAVREITDEIPEKVTPHIMRHTKAMHLAEANVNPIYIRDILGHADLSTIGVYVKSSMKMKKDALEKTAIISQAISEETSDWATDASTIEWLKNYGKNIM